MSYFRKKFLPWVFPVFNGVLVTMTSAAITTLGISYVSDAQAVNLLSKWNADITVNIFLLNWAAQFAVWFYGYLQKSPLPAPDPE